MLVPRGSAMPVSSSLAPFLNSSSRRGMGAAAFAMANISRPGLPLQIYDNYSVTITGNPGQTVAYTEGGQNYVQGATDGNGNFTSTGLVVMGSDLGQAAIWTLDGTPVGTVVFPTTTAQVQATPQQVGNNPQALAQCLQENSPTYCYATWGSPSQLLANSTQGGPTPNITPALGALLGLPVAATFYFTGGNVNNNGTQFLQGQQWFAKINTAAPNTPVTSIAYKSGNPQPIITQWGNTDALGNFSTSGVMQPSDVGSWQETWYVGGTMVGNPAGFTVTGPIYPYTTGPSIPLPVGAPPPPSPVISTAPPSVVTPPYVPPVVQTPPTPVYLPALTAPPSAPPSAPTTSAIISSGAGTNLVPSSTLAATGPAATSTTTAAQPVAQPQAGAPAATTSSFDIGAFLQTTYGGLPVWAWGGIGIGAIILLGGKK